MQHAAYSIQHAAYTQPLAFNVQSFLHRTLQQVRQQCSNENKEQESGGEFIALLVAARGSTLLVTATQTEEYL